MSGSRRTPVPATPEIRVPLIEVFSSMQGEGVLLGTRQVFVRFADCNLDCDYCDTPFVAGPVCEVEAEPGSMKSRPIDNPVSLAEITSLVVTWHHSNSRLHHSVALTGGEPLLHADSLKAWLPDVLPVLPVFLETNGTLPGELEKVISLVDMVSMDIKGASVTGVETPWHDHADFISVAADRLCQIKMVVDTTTPDEEILEAASLASRSVSDTPFILQPRTLVTGPAMEGEALLALQRLAATEHPDVRIIPQVHPWLGVA